MRCNISCHVGSVGALYVSDIASLAVVKLHLWVKQPKICGAFHVVAIKGIANMTMELFFSCTMERQLLNLISPLLSQLQAVVPVDYVCREASCKLVMPS